MRETFLRLQNGKEALIDADLASELRKFKWYQLKSGYVIRNEYRGMKNGKRDQATILLHRQVMDDPKGKEIDHVNGDKMDNRRVNLRPCTRAQNSGNHHILPRNNTSGIVGVNMANRKLKKPWRAFISHKNRQVFLGWFATKEEAKEAYTSAAKKLFGEFASTKV